LINTVEGWFNTTWHFAKTDYQGWPLRFILEMLAWAISIGCSVAMMLTVPTPPFLILYPVWISGCIIYGWAAWTRGSFGMMANYLLMSAIDIIALARMISKVV